MICKRSWRRVTNGDPTPSPQAREQVRLHVGLLLMWVLVQLRIHKEGVLPEMVGKKLYSLGSINSTKDNASNLGLGLGSQADATVMPEKETEKRVLMTSAAAEVVASDPGLCPDWEPGSDQLCSLPSLQAYQPSLLRGSQFWFLVAVPLRSSGALPLLIQIHLQ